MKISILLSTAIMAICAVSMAEDVSSQHILTPPPPLTPRINGAKVFGVRPGSPFLFKVPATGEKPLRYVAKNLPKGLQIDSATGIISGSVKLRGSYIVKLGVQNSHGKAVRSLRIEVGDQICLTPPMGWNSWYCHSELISEEAVRETARAMEEKGLIDHGWTYVNIDDCWQGVRGGKYNAIQPNERFNDIKGMCDYIHSLGLKAGIYSTPWMGTYAGFIGGSAPNADGDYSEFYLPSDQRLQPHQFFGRYPGSINKKLNRVGRWFFDKDAKQWADWGFDYVKVDWKPNDVPTAKRMHKDLYNCNRNIVLSLSNAAPFENAEGLAELANCWRTTGDIHDNWGSVSGIGFGQEKWQDFTQSGHWNDPDMLQVGRIGIPNRKNKTFMPTHLTPDEQYSQVSLWCILSAPLLLSCDIASLDEFTLSLLTNDEVLEVNQDPAGNPAKRVIHDEGREIWTKTMEDGSTVVGLFNLSSTKSTMTFHFSDIDITGTKIVRDLWRQKDLDSFKTSFSSEVNSHGVVLVRVK
jgi:alpha-galactosidase